MFPSWNHSRTLRTAVVADHHGFRPDDSGLPGLQPAEVTLIRTGTADPDPYCNVLKGEDPGEPGNSRYSRRFISPRFGLVSLYPISKTRHRGGWLTPTEQIIRRNQTET